jgi:rhodanese-related sulfurtransferase
LAAHRDRRIVVHCHHGGRSLRVANWLRGQGFEQAQSMAGGIDAWSTEIDPAVPRY